MLNSTRIVLDFSIHFGSEDGPQGVGQDGSFLVLQNEQSEAGQARPSNFQCKLESIEPNLSSSSVNLKATHYLVSNRDGCC
jgi:hypothetical protein